MFTPFEYSGAGPTLRGVEGPRHGPTVLFLHGVVRRWQDFGPLLPALAGRWHVVAVDHRGHGTSDRARRYLVADYVADAVAIVRALDRPAVVVGHSLGGLTALGLAAEAPDFVRAVVLEDPPSAGFLANLETTPYAATFAAYRRLADCGRPVAAIAAELGEVRLPGGVRLRDQRDAVSLRFLARCLADLDPAAVVPVLEGRWLDGFDPLAVASRCACPALLLAANPAEGGMLPAADAAALAAALPDPVRVDLPGVGHLAHATDPPRFARLLVSFLDSL